MNEPSFLGLAQNIALLMAVLLIFDILLQRKDAQNLLSKKIVVGLLMGGTGLVVMLTPWVFLPGVVFDTRSVLLGISGLFFGTIPTLIAMLMTAAFRFYQGGGGTLTGILVILVTGTTGIIWRHLRKKSLARISWGELFLFGLVIHIFMLGLMITLPGGLFQQVIRSIGLPVLALFPLGTALLGFLLRNRIQREQTQEILQDTTSRLNTAQKLGKIGGWEWNPNQKTMYWTDEVYRIHGLDPADYPDGSVELVGESILCYMEDGKDIIQTAFENCVNNGQPYDIELPFKSMDGEQKWIRTSGEPVYEKGEIIKVIGNIMDITDRKNAEIILEEERRRLESIIEGTNVGTWEWEIQTGKTIFNERWAEMKGYSLEELSPVSIETWKKFIYPDDYQKAMDMLERHFAGELEYYEIESRMQHKDGHWIWILDRGKVSVWDEERKPLLMQGTHQDITIRKEGELALRESEERYRKLLEIAPVGIGVISEGKVSFINQIGAQMLGAINRNQIMGLPIEKFIHPDELEETLSRIQSMLAGETDLYPVTSTYLRLDGSPMKVEIMAAALTFRGKPAMQIVVNDISERILAEEKILADQVILQNLLKEAENSRRALLSVIEDQKEAEEKIRCMNLELEERVSERTSQLESSNKELEAFAYSVSHDLRAPLRGIDGFSKILEQEYEDQLDTEGKRLIKIIRSSTKKMDQLIIDMLALSRVSRSQLRFIPLDMTSLAKTVYKEIAEPEAVNEFSFQVSEMPMVAADPTLIHQVWTNLISNAIKYTMPMKERIIEVGGYEEDGYCIYFVKDSGVGFNPQYKDKLFGLFQRLHKESEFEGTGVGLAIVQRIVHRHGGKVWAEGEVDQGATFYFSIPERQANIA